MNTGKNKGNKVEISENGIRRSVQLEKIVGGEDRSTGCNDLIAL
jgi:hypothetical protein